MLDSKTLPSLLWTSEFPESWINVSIIVNRIWLNHGHFLLSLEFCHRHFAIVILVIKVWWVPRRAGGPSILGKVEQPWFWPLPLVIVIIVIICLHLYHCHHHLNYYPHTVINTWESGLTLILTIASCHCHHRNWFSFYLVQTCSSSIITCNIKNPESGHDSAQCLLSLSPWSSLLSYLSSSLSSSSTSSQLLSFQKHKCWHCFNFTDYSSAQGKETYTAKRRTAMATICRMCRSNTCICGSLINCYWILS